MAELNEIIHQPVRLRIMAMLATVPAEMQVTFHHLKKTLGLTDGNLGAHLQKLEEAGYVIIIKTFVQKKPQTYVAITEMGSRAFKEHCAALQEILEGNVPFAEREK
ncbi:MAG: transcriptional regulator [Ktedonobacteraceae bacterium]|nr:transcriptional regulator [Ktedonobacteraceae bacterium]